jgi:hypothetical protein
MQMQTPRINRAVGALVEGIRDIVLEGAKDRRFAVEVRDDLGRVLQSRRSWRLNFLESSNPSGASYLNALRDIAAHRFLKPQLAPFANALDLLVDLRVDRVFLTNGRVS